MHHLPVRSGRTECIIYFHLGGCNKERAGWEGGGVFVREPLGMWLLVFFCGWKYLCGTSV